MLAKLYNRKFVSCVFSLIKFIDAIDIPEDYDVEEKRYYRTGEIFNDKIFHIIIEQSDIIDTRFDNMIIERLIVSDSEIKNSVFSNVQFIEATFEQVKFSATVFVSCTFYYCLINQCDLDCKFINCRFINLETENRDNLRLSCCSFEDNIKARL